MSVVAVAQVNIQKGFVVTTKGDTIKGEINNLLWQESPEFVTFTGAKKVVYQATDLLAFSAGEHTIYKSYKVKIDSTGGSGGERRRNSSPTIYEDHVFLKVILDGEVSLLKLRQGFRTHYYYQVKDNVPQELISHQNEVEIGNQVLVQIGNQFIPQLRRLMGDCPGVEVREDMKYLEKSLIKLFTQYNECKKNNSRVIGDEPKRRYVGVVAAAHYDDFAYTYTAGLGYTGGIFYEVTFPRKVYKTSWYNELVCYKYGQLTGDGRGFYAAKENYKFSPTSIRLTTMVKSQFLYSKLRPYLLAGAGKIFWLNDLNFYVNGTKQEGDVGGGWDLVLGGGLYVTDALSLEIRGQQSLLIQYDGYYFFGGGGGNCTSVGLSAAYHFRVGK